MTLRAVWNVPAAAALGLVCGLVLARCQVQLDPNGVYGCAADSDCGGGGYKCAPNDAGAKYCCLPAAEVCDGLDNDCNGLVDDAAPASCFPFDAGTPGVGRCVAGQSACGGACQGAVGPLAETCNNADDNCDGRIDDGFDLLNDPANCGQCGHACPAPDGGTVVCFDGGCLLANELDCSNGLDDDDDGLTDCADPDCNMQSCGAGCQCRTGAAAEADCSDGINNDQDLAGTDCADPDCDLQSCGAGCECVGGAAVEVLCGDRIDNDRDDAGTDCADLDCDLQSCGAGCECQAGAAVETRCWDGLNNDSDDAGTDCADPDCAGAGCGADGGVDCLCVGGRASERVCDDNLDNDGDGNADCRDTVDCPLGTPCDATGGTCQNNRQCR